MQIIWSLFSRNISTYVRFGGSREKRANNNAFYFRHEDEKVRVCKTFFKGTLDINDRPIRTVQEKRNKLANTLLDSDNRGKHNKHNKTDPILKEQVKNFIEKIPKIESHYTRANTSKHFIDGSKSIGPLNMSQVKITTVKVLRVERESPNSLFFKTSYEDDFTEVNIIKRKKTNDNITRTPAFHLKPKIADNKRKDLLELIQKQHIPRVYNTFFQNL